MRCLIISARHHPQQGGVGACVRAFVDAAMEAGWHIELITRPGEFLPRVSRLHLLHTPDEEPHFERRIEGLRRIERIRPYRYGLWSLAVAECLRDESFDVDVVQFIDVQAEGFVSILSRDVRRSLGGVPMIVSAHGPMHLVESLTGKDPDRFGRTIYHDWERQALRGADGVLGLSPLLLHAIGPFRRQRAIPPIVSRSSFKKKSTTSRRITLIGDIEHHKGVDVWARSLNVVFRSLPDVQAVMIGSDTFGGPGGTSLTAHVRSLIDPIHRGRFHAPGKLDHERTMQELEHSALVVVPSRFDSFSYVAAEALQRGTAVLISDQVGIGQWVNGLPTTWAGDVQALASGQIELLDHGTFGPGQLERCAEQMYRSCSADRVLGAYESFVKSLAPGIPGAVSGGEDSIDRMRSFLGEVEARERQFHGASMGEPMKVP